MVRKAIIIGSHSQLGLPVRMLLMVLIAAFSWQCARAQVPVASDQRIIHESWTFKEGAPEDVESLAQTSDGYLWLGTESGLFRFDGIRFEPFRSPFGDQLLSTNISAVFAPATGGLWVGYRLVGFAFIKDGRVTNFPVAIPSVFGFAQDQHGIVWAATTTKTGGLWRFDGSSWQNITAEWNAPAVPICQVGFGREGTLWVLSEARGGAAKQLFYLPPGSGQFRKASDNVQVESFTWDADRTVVTTQVRPEPSSGVEFEGSLPSYPVLKKDSLQILDRANGVWFSPRVEPGMWRHPAGEPIAEVVRRNSRKDSLPFDINSYRFAILVDREGSVWLGDQKGVHRLSYTPLVEQPLPQNVDSFAVSPDEGGVVWISAGNLNGSSNLFRVASGNGELQKSPAGIANFAYGAADGTLWFGGEGGLWHMVKGAFTNIELPPAISDSARNLQTITQDRLGGMWVSFGPRGLYRFADGTWTPNGGRHDLPNSIVISTFTDSLGRVWFGCRNELAVLADDRVQIFGPDAGIHLGAITAIYGRGPGIWVGGEFGLQYFNQGVFHTVNAVDRESLRGISGIVETTNGDLWLNGLGGVLHIRRAEIVKALENPAYLVSGERFGKRDGVPGVPHQTRPLATAIEGTDGRLWFTGSSGVVSIDPTRASNGAPPPAVTIESISADDKGYRFDLPIRFPAHTPSVEITYAAVSLRNPEAIRYRYKLQEIEKDWHEAGTSTSVSYRNLAPGSYHFLVSGTDTNGLWTGNTAAVEFTVLPAFYQTNWFRALCAMVFVGLLWAAYQLRVRQLQKQFEITLDARVDERTRIARDLHDTLLQSAHGLLLRFQTVSQLLPGRHMDAKERLDNAIEQTAEFITEARDEVQGLRASTVETNDLALAISTVGEELAVDCTDHRPVFHVAVEGEPRNLHPILRDEIYKIATEALRNAFCHSQARRIEVEIRYDNEQFRLRVRDDGKGIDPALLSARNNEGHYGLQGMRERATLIGGKLVVWSEVGAGTEVELRVASNIAFAAGRKHDRVTGNSAGIAKA